MCVGRKGSAYFKRRPQYEVEGNFEVGQAPTIKEAQAIADEIFADFVSEVRGWGGRAHQLGCKAGGCRP